VSDPDTSALPVVGDSIAGSVSIVHDAARSLIDADAPLTRLTGGGIWAEGPVYLPDIDTVMYSDVRANRGIRWSPSSGGTHWRVPNGNTNGNTLDREGRVIHCEHYDRRLGRTELGGTRHGLVDSFNGKRLNSPNDVVVQSDGSIWFTDPPYGIIKAEEGQLAPQEQPACHVFRFDPEQAELTAVSDHVVHPNGLAFSPDESLLYVSDTSKAADPQGNHHIVVFDVNGASLENMRVFAVMEPGLADGMRVDEHGNVWSSAEDGIHVIAPDGRDLARIKVPEITANCVFGGRTGRTLFITASSSLYAIETHVEGAGVAAQALRTIRT
jgi:gluconolactonase